MGYIHWIDAASNEERIEEAARAPSLAELQAFVGGYIELVPVMYKGKREQMIVNEEAGLMPDKFVQNAKASEIYYQRFIDECRDNGRPLPNLVRLRGNAIVLEGLQLD